MAVVYIAEQGASLHKRGDRLYVFKGSQLFRWFHAKDVVNLILVGNIGITSQTVTYLLSNRIDTVFLSYYGKYKGRLLGEMGKNIELRLQQFRYLEHEANKLSLAQLYIQAKIDNMVRHLKARQKRVKSPKIARSIIALSAIGTKLAYPVAGIDVLMGYEGIASKHYFHVFPELIIHPDFTFNGRTRRPPKDEVNALLSLGYTFLMNQIMTQAYIVGLDPYYGALHAVDYGRQSLVLDLMEEFRPLIDNLVLYLINRKELRKEHFAYNVTPDEEQDAESDHEHFLPVSLKPEGMKLFVMAFSNLLNSKFRLENPNAEFNLQYIMQMQARKLAAHFMAEKTYQGFKWL
jgi:CRISPR-associated protein Cas1